MEGTSSVVWTAPTAGPDVEYYIVEVSTNGGGWVAVADAVDTTTVLTATVGDTLVVRVAGVDSLGHQGIYSVPSLPHVQEAQ